MGGGEHTGVLRIPDTTGAHHDIGDHRRVWIGRLSKP
jgi:hypothetical protein